MGIGSVSLATKCSMSALVLIVFHSNSANAIIYQASKFVLDPVSSAKSSVTAALTQCKQVMLAWVCSGSSLPQQPRSL